MDSIRLEEIVIELRKMNVEADNEDVWAAIAYLDCARWNIENEQKIYHVVPQVVTIAAV